MKRGSCDGDRPNGNVVQRPSKRARRGQYTSRACDQCQRRKIKCDGGVPCQPCSTKGRDCQRHGTDMRGRWRENNRASGTDVDLASRLTRLEREITSIRNPGPHSIETTKNKRDGAGQEDCSRFMERNELNLPDSHTSPKLPTFSGETSIAHNLTLVEGRLEEMGVEYSRLRSTSPTHEYRSNLTPSRESPISQPLMQEMSCVQRAFRNHGIIPNRGQWEGIMNTFCEEVHILVPFLHLPDTRRLFERVWDISFDQDSSGNNFSEMERFQIAHVLLCLANGRCVESSRFEGDDGPYSAGWSFYSAAREIFGDLLDGFSLCENQIFLLQTVVLMVVYLFRLDAHGPAEKVLSMSISHAHHLGLQRKRVVDSMNTFEGEMSRRLWWCIYLLDRRLSIETGRPFLIQDVNVDVGLPRDISDHRLEHHRGTERLKETGEDGSGEPTAVPYLVAMTSYSRVIGKVWESLYGAACLETTPSMLLNEYLEHLIIQSQKCIQHEFAYDPFNPGSSDSGALQWWQVKQHFIMRIRWSSIHLLIRKPMLQRLRPVDQPEMIKNEVVCMQLAQRIIDDFRKVPEDHPKYTFPFLHYLTNATIIALGLIIKQPSFKRAYGKFTIEASRSLRQHCRKTWMSGKMVRTVWKLNRMADAILAPSEHSYESSLPLNKSSAASGVAASFPSGSNATATGGKFGLCSPGVNGRDRTTHQDPNPSMDTYSHGQQSSGISQESGRGHLSSFSSGGDTSTISRQAGGRIGGEESSRGFIALEGTASHHVTPSDLDLSVSFPGEMIDDGMEWLQTLFASGLETNLLPVWD